MHITCKRLIRTGQVLLLLGFAGPLRALDLDNNQISDLWEERYGTDAGASDPDGDGLSNVQESQLGTNPNDANSRLALILSAPKPDQLLLDMQTQPGKRYQLEASKDLLSWQPIGPLLESLGGSMSVALGSAAQGFRFYRCRWAGDLDSDGDGFSAWEESLLGTRDDDADNNGLADAWELARFGHVGVDPDADPDADGFSNLQEFLANTDPLPPGPLITLETPAAAQLLR